MRTISIPMYTPTYQIVQAGDSYKSSKIKKPFSRRIDLLVQEIGGDFLPLPERLFYCPLFLSRSPLVLGILSDISGQNVPNIPKEVVDLFSDLLRSEEENHLLLESIHVNCSALIGRRFSGEAQGFPCVRGRLPMIRPLLWTIQRNEGGPLWEGPPYQSPFLFHGKDEASSQMYHTPLPTVTYRENSLTPLTEEDLPYP